MQQYKKKIITRKRVAIASLLAILLVTIVLSIVGIFLPIKYFRSYTVQKSRAAAGVMRVTYVDVGNGDSTIVELPDGKNLLIDGGNGEYSHTSNIIKWLNMRDINKIDFLVCSSVNAYSCGGLSEILKYKEIGKVYIPHCENFSITEAYKDFSKRLRKIKVQVKESEYGDKEEGDGWFFKILSPSQLSSGNSEYDILNSNPTIEAARNNASAVVWLEYLDKGFMFCGNAQKDILDKVVKSYVDLKQGYAVDLSKCLAFKVPILGRKEGYSEQLYDVLQPKLSIISLEVYTNGLPDAKIVSYLGKYGTVYQTQERGTITVCVTKNGYIVDYDKKGAT